MLLLYLTVLLGVGLYLILLAIQSRGIRNILRDKHPLQYRRIRAPTLRRFLFVNLNPQDLTVTLTEFVHEKQYLQLGDALVTKKCRRLALLNSAYAVFGIAVMTWFLVIVFVNHGR